MDTWELVLLKARKHLDPLSLGLDICPDLESEAMLVDRTGKGPAAGVAAQREELPDDILSTAEIKVGRNARQAGIQGGQEYKVGQDHKAGRIAQQVAFAAVLRSLCPVLVCCSSCT